MIEDRRPPRPAGRARLRRRLALPTALLVAVPLLAALPGAPAAAAPADGVLRVLLFYKDNFHASHVQARQAARDVAAQVGATYNQPVDIQETQDPAVFTTSNLATKDALVFAQTGGVLFNDSQRAALEGYIRGGGGFVGLHYTGWSVGQSEHDVNPFYARLVGAASEGHPENPPLRPGRVVVKSTGHPLTQGLPAEFTRTDEWYDWVVNPAPNVRTLLEADEASYASDDSGGRQGTTHPITWCQTIDAGRSWYTGMGHASEHYSETVIRTQLRNGLAYAAGLLPADCSPPRKDATGGWSGVTPWPLMPINAALTSDGRVQSFGSVATGCVDGNPYDWSGNTCVAQGGQFEVDVWNPATPRTTANLRDGIVPNTTYTDLFCAMQVQDPHDHSTMTVGGDDGLGDANTPNSAAIGVTRYSTNNGLQTEAPMVFPRWYPTGTTMPNGDIVVQGGSEYGTGGAGIPTPEVRAAGGASGWRALTGARSPVAYGDGGADHAGQDENRWWYPRAFVAPGRGTLFTITGTQMFELDPTGAGTLTLRGAVPASVANQGGLGNPVGATSTATMYRPGRILQVGGGWWGNGGGPDGARAGFTVDITGANGTAAPVIAATRPMRYQRHWATSTVLPDGDVLVTGGGRENNGRDDTVTNPEIWDPDTGAWTTVEVPHEHARLYHSTALLLPDGRVMLGGGGAPGPRNYTDVEFYSPAYLFDGNAAAPRPQLSGVPATIGYGGAFTVTTPSRVSRVTLVRNGSVTHGFNNDQNFQDLSFTQTPGSRTVSITAPPNGTFAPPGAYMLFVFDANGTPSVAPIVKINPAAAATPAPAQFVDQFEYPRVPAEWRGANPPTVVDVPAGDTRMSPPWTVQGGVQLVRSAAPSNGGLGLTGYHLALGPGGRLERTVTGLEPGRQYRVSLRYARDSRSAGTGAASARLTVGSLDATITATAAQPSQSTRSGTFGTYTGTFTASAATQTLALAGTGAGAVMIVDDLVAPGSSPGGGSGGGGGGGGGGGSGDVEAVPVHYRFDEAGGTSAANSGTDTTTGPAALTGGTAFVAGGRFGRGLDLPGGATSNAVDLPDNLLQGAQDFTVSLWARPDQLNPWTSLFHIGNGTGNSGSYLQIQSQTQTAGPSGLAVTIKDDGAGSPEQRVLDAATDPDLVVGQWNHVAFTRQGATGILYLNGAEVARSTSLSISLADLGPTSNNWLGRNGYPDPAFDGHLDDVRLYRTALSAAGIAALRAGPLPVHYRFDEAGGTSAANSGTDTTTGPAALTGGTAFVAGGRFGRGLDLPGGAVGNAVDLPDNLLQGAQDFTVSLWARPDQLTPWTSLFHIGNGTGNSGSYLQIQSQTQTAGPSGLAVTFKDDGAGSPEERVLDAATDPDLVAGQWNHVAFTRQGATGILYLNGAEVARRTDLTISLADLGPTSNNWLGRNGYPDPAFDGALDEVRAYRTALSPAEIAALRAGPLPVRYQFEEASGTAAASSGTDTATGAAVLTGGSAFTAAGRFGRGVDLPGGANANVVDLPDNLLQGAQDFTVSLWARPDQLNPWTSLFHVGNGAGNSGSYLQIQSQTQTAGPSGLAVTFKDDGAGSPEQRVLDAATDPDLVVGQWNHVAFTRQGSVGVLYLNGVEVARSASLSISLADLGPTSNNWLGRNGYPDLPFDGALDDVRLYRTGLSAAQVGEVFQGS